jgi:hypothetical protein
VLQDADCTARLRYHFRCRAAYVNAPCGFLLTWKARKVVAPRLLWAQSPPFKASETSSLTHGTSTALTAARNRHFIIFESVYTIELETKCHDFNARLPACENFKMHWGRNKLTATICIPCGEVDKAPLRVLKRYGHEWDIPRKRARRKLFTTDRVEAISAARSGAVQDCGAPPVSQSK